MNLGMIGWPRVVRGLREGDQTVLLTGAALLFLHYLRTTKPRKQLLYRKIVPVGSTVVVRNSRRGDPKLEIHKPPRRSAQTR